MKHGRDQHRALVALQSIRVAERHAAEQDLVLAGQAEAAAMQQARLARAATDVAVYDWTAQVRGGFDPAFARALAQRVTDRLHDADIAREEAEHATGQRRETEHEWRLSDARARQSDTLLERSRRALARKRETVALDRQSDQAAQRWSRS